MTQLTANKRQFKQAVKEALTEVLLEQRALLHSVVAEVLEDFAVAEAIRAGRKTGTVGRAAVMRTLRSGR